MKGIISVSSGSSTSRRLLKIVILIIILSVIAQPVMAAKGGLRVIPPTAKPYGKTYNEWNAAWWQYVVSFPASTNPITDPTGANCGVGQSGPVFFLVGTTGVSAVRDDCVVPVGKAIFFPILNDFCAVPEDGATSQDIRDLCSWVIDYIDTLYVIVDGVSLMNPMDFRAPSPDFSFDGAIDNPFDMACGTPGTCYEGYHEIGFSDGYYAMLPPLPPGEHTINFGGHWYVDEWNWDFEVDITYNLTVAGVD